MTCRLTRFSFDAIHISPPCQLFSCGTGRYKYIKDYPDLLPIAREVLAGHPHSIIENVQGAPMRVDLKLWGPNFGLGPTHKKDGLWRPRLFELSFWVRQPPKPKLQKGRTLSITKRLSAKNHFYRRKAQGLPGKVTRQEALDVMGYPKWVQRTPITEAEIAESVPPPYAEYIGKELLARMREAWYVSISDRRCQLWASLVNRGALELPF